VHGFAVAGVTEADSETACGPQRTSFDHSHLVAVVATARSLERVETADGRLFTRVESGLGQFDHLLPGPCWEKRFSLSFAPDDSGSAALLRALRRRDDGLARLHPLAPGIEINRVAPASYPHNAGRRVACGDRHEATYIRCHTRSTAQPVVGRLRGSRQVASGALRG
jgi:hypothetical protein